MDFIPSSKNILIVVGDSQRQQILSSLISGEGYNIKTCASQDEAVEILCGNTCVDLIISDFEQPLVNGKEFCGFIRASFRLRHICIILIINTEDPLDKIRAIDAGADDYIQEDYDPKELLIRLKTSLLRSARDPEASLLTKLPGNISLIKELEKRISSGVPLAAACLDLDKFKEFNECYGFENGDKIINYTSQIIVKAIQELGNRTDFLAYIGADDFVFITTPDCIEEVCNKIIVDFDNGILDFYSETDRKRGFIVTKNRGGAINKIPPLSVSIGICTNEKKRLSHIGEIIQVATELKNYAKTLRGSNFVKDRRKGK